MGQNDARSNVIINRLIGLRQNLDNIFEQIGEQLEKTEDENYGLKNEIKRINEFKIAQEDLLEQKRNSDRQIQRMSQELQAFRRRDDEQRG